MAPVARLHPSGDGYELLGTRFAELEFGAAGHLLPGRLSSSAKL